jgi:hypothetical protein
MPYTPIAGKIRNPIVGHSTRREPIARASGASMAVSVSAGTLRGAGRGLAAFQICFLALLAAKVTGLGDRTVAGRVRAFEVVFFDWHDGLLSRPRCGSDDKGAALHCIGRQPAADGSMFARFFAGSFLSYHAG